MLDLEPAAREVVRLLEGITDDRLADPTRCADRSVAALLDHLKSFVLLSDTDVILWDTFLCGEGRIEGKNVEAGSAAAGFRGLGAASPRSGETVRERCAAGGGGAPARRLAAERVPLVPGMAAGG
jgi:hypothetical protein